MNNSDHSKPRIFSSKKRPRAFIWGIFRRFFSFKKKITNIFSNLEFLGNLFFYYFFGRFFNFFSLKFFEKNNFFLKFFGKIKKI